MQSVIVECKLPKKRKWSDPDVIKMDSPYSTFYKYNRNEYGKYCYFYPIDNDLYIKGMFSYQKKARFKHMDGYYTEDWVLDKNVIVKLTNYKNLTAIEADSIIGECTIVQSMVHTVWDKLGLRQGYMVPVLKDLG